MKTSPHTIYQSATQSTKYNSGVLIVLRLVIIGVLKLLQYILTHKATLLAAILIIGVIYLPIPEDIHTWVAVGVFLGTVPILIVMSFGWVGLSEDVKIFWTPVSATLLILWNNLILWWGYLTKDVPRSSPDASGNTVLLIWIVGGALLIGIILPVLTKIVLEAIEQERNNLCIQNHIH